MLSHKSDDVKDGAAYREPQVDTVEDIGVPMDENYHGLTLSVVLIYLVRLYCHERIIPLLMCKLVPQASVATLSSHWTPYLMWIVPQCVRSCIYSSSLTHASLILVNFAGMITVVSSGLVSAASFSCPLILATNTTEPGGHIHG